MPFVPITTAEIQSGQPVIGPVGFGQKTKENFDFLNGQIGSLEAQTILNGSFEVEEGATGIPANWERTLFPGGAGVFETADPMHGAKGYKFTHPGGGGNGGGTLESDFFAMSEIRGLQLEWMHYVSAAAMHETVEVEYFTDAQVSISTQTIYDSVANPTAATMYQRALTIPATARFIKVTLIGGDDDVDVAGDSFWDGVRIAFPPAHEAGDYVLAINFNSDDTVAAPLAKLLEFRLGGSGELRILFRLSNATGNGSAKIYRNGQPVGLLRSVASDTTDFSEDIAGWSSGDTCELWAAAASATSTVSVFRLLEAQPFSAGMNNALP